MRFLRGMGGGIVFRLLSKSEVNCRDEEKRTTAFFYSEGRWRSSRIKGPASPLGKSDKYEKGSFYFYVEGCSQEKKAPANSVRWREGRKKSDNSFSTRGRRRIFFRMEGRGVPCHDLTRGGKGFISGKEGPKRTGVENSPFEHLKTVSLIPGRREI